VILLQISTEDGVIENCFNNKKEAEAWLEHFKNEPGWKESNLVNMIDKTDEAKNENQRRIAMMIELSDRLRARTQLLKTKKQNLKELKNKNLGAAEINQAITLLIELIEED